MSRAPGRAFLAPAYVRGVTPYPTGKPADELRAELGVERLIHLATNENTTGPSPRALEAIRRSAAEAHHYPDGGGSRLRRLLAARHRVEPGQVVLGNGSSEVVDLVCRTFLSPGQRAVVSRLGFLQYRVSAQVSGARVEAVAPVDEGRGDDAEGLAAAARSARVVFIANPNNPTGTLLTRSQLDAYFAAAGDGALTVIDQAYREYADHPEYPDAVDDLRAGRRVLVLHTFSKIHGLAGLRIGYGVGPAPVVEQMERARLPFNTSSIAQAAALAALGDADHVAAVRLRNAEERRWLAEELARRGCSVTPSAANFLLVDPPVPAREVVEGLRARGVLVCPMAAYALPGSVRVTVGTREENEGLLAALDQLAPVPVP